MDETTTWENATRIWIGHESSGINNSVIDALKNDAYCFDVEYDEKKHQITAGINLSNNADGDDYTVIIYGKNGDNRGKITIHNWNIML